jgi:hypothetical protein
MFKLVTAVERLAESERKVSIALFGPYGIGKTSLVRSLDPEHTLFLDCEAGMLPVRDWPGRSVSIRDYSAAMDLFCLIGGADPAANAADPFSAAHHGHVTSVYRELDLTGITTLFLDSLSEATRLCLVWAQNQPQAFSERTGRPDLRTAYGVMAKEMTRALRHLQHAPAHTTIFVGGLQNAPDSPGRWEPQLEGSKVGRELPFITDQVVTFDLFDWSKEADWQHAPGSGAVRAFCCRSPNPWRLPAKDRSGRLDLIEEPHLGRLIEKITGTT